MARQRFIWPTMWSDPALGRLDSDALLLYIGCFSLADDDGRILGDPAFLRAQVFPYKDFTLAHVQGLRDAISEASSSFHVYTVDGVDYIAFLNWSTFQKPKYPKPSSLPPPPKPKRRKLPEVFPEDSPNVSGNLPEASATGLGRDGLGRDGKGKPPKPPTPVGVGLALVIEEKPALTKVEGRDLAFDALADACGIQPNSPRRREVATALNGARGRPGIRELYWDEWGGTRGDAFERMLAGAVREMASLYRRKMNGAALTPTALWKWWVDLPSMHSLGDNGSTSADALLAHAMQLRKDESA